MECLRELRSFLPTVYLHFGKLFVFRRIYIVLMFACMLCACSGLGEARHTVATADSLRVNEGRLYDDSLALAEAYVTTGKWRYIYPNDYARACYYYGYMLRQHGDQVAAMRAFIAGTHAPYIQRVVPLPWFSDYHILGRIYSNMGSVAHLATDFALSYTMYERSSEVFMLCRDTLAYYYALNDMAFEKAMLADKQGTYALLGEIERCCINNGLQASVLRTKAELNLCTQQYDSAIYYANRLQLTGHEGSSGQLIKAQAFSYLSRKDSATHYARLVLADSALLGNINNALYILTNDDESIDAEAIRQVAADRADTQKLLEIRQGKLSQATQLLLQELHRKPDWRAYTIIALIVLGVIITIVVTLIGKKHKQQIQEQASVIETNQTNMLESIRKHIDSSNLEATLRWKDYKLMRTEANLYMTGIISKLESYNLNEVEIRFCVLTLLDFRLNQIAGIIRYSYPSGIKTLKRRISEKLGTSAPELKDFLLHLTAKT